MGHLPHVRARKRFLTGSILLCTVILLAYPQMADAWRNLDGASPLNPAPIEPGRFYPAPKADVESVPHLGLTMEVAKSLADHAGISLDQAFVALREQGKSAGLEEALRTRLGSDFGQLSFDIRTASWRVDVTRPAATADALMVFERFEIDNPRVGSQKLSAEKFSVGVAKLASDLARLNTQGKIAFNASADGHADIAVSADLSTSIVESIQEIAASSDIETSLKVVASIDQASPHACGAHYCDAPFLAGLRYGSTKVSCTSAFKAFVSGSAAQYNLTAGHCVSVPNWPNPGLPVFTCNAATSSCPYIGYDLGGYFGGGGGDGGVMTINNSNWGTYPGIRIHGWTWATYAIYGSQSVSVGMYVCKTGYQTGTTCGTVESTNWAGVYSTGELLTGMIVTRGACGIPGDSGGPLFNPANLKALGINSGGWATPDCASGVQRTIQEPVTRALNTLGLSGISQ